MKNFYEEAASFSPLLVVLGVLGACGAAIRTSGGHWLAILASIAILRLFLIE